MTMATVLLLAALVGVASGVGGAEVPLLAGARPAAHAVVGAAASAGGQSDPAAHAIAGRGGAESQLLPVGSPAAHAIAGGARAAASRGQSDPAIAGGARAAASRGQSDPAIAGGARAAASRAIAGGARAAASHGAQAAGRQLDPWPPAAHAVVEGSCSGGAACYGTISKALHAAPLVVKDEKKRYVILVKAGEYHESVTITRKNVVLLGEGADKTWIIASKSNASGTLMNETATINAFGHGFLAQDLTIRNAAGPNGRQAVALRSNSNKSVVYRCRIEGYEGTLYAENGLQFYIESNITGTVDFVFGNAKAVFQKCRLQVRRPLDGKHNVITAQGRNKANATDSGFAFHECVVEAAPGHDLNGFDTFLGRPYKKFSHVAFIDSFLGGVVNATGWVPWEKDVEVKETTETVEYREYGNQGPGADTARRVNWPGLKILNDSAEAAKFTPDRFIGASLWVPEQIPYDHGLGAPPLVPGAAA